MTNKDKQERREQLIQGGSTKQIIDGDVWTKMDIDKCYMLKNIISEEYVVDKKIVDDMIEYNLLYSRELEEKAKEKDDTELYYVYVTFNTTGSPTISYTTLNVLTALKKSIARSLQNKRSSVVNSTDYVGIKAQLLGCVKGDHIDKNILIKIKIFFGKKVEDKREDEPNTNVENKFCNIIDHFLLADEKINKYTCEPLTCYIYELYDEKSNKSFIDCEYQEIKTEDTKTLLTKAKLKNEKMSNITNKNIILKILKKYKCMTKIHGDVHTDTYISNNKTIENGYNQCYKIIEKEIAQDKNISSSTTNRTNAKYFTMVQKELCLKSLVDDNDYDSMSGFIYQITNTTAEEKKFISYIDLKKPTIGEEEIKNLKDIISCLYDGGFSNKHKFSKLSNVMKMEPYNNFKIEILIKKGKRSKINLVEKTLCLINKFKSETLGYNMNVKPVSEKFIKKK